LICGSLKWLRDFQKQQDALEPELAPIEFDPDEPDWVRDFIVEKQKADMVSLMESKKAEREKKRAYLATIRNNRPTQTHKRTRVQDDMELNVSNDLIDPYESENENNEGEFNLNQVEFDRPPVQIIYASRTVWSFYSSIHSYRNLCTKSKKPLILISSV
jgi:hypothetical protein